MNTKTIVILVVVIIVVLAGGYFVATSMSPAAPAQGQAATGSTATSTPQVQGQDVKVGTGEVAAPGSSVSVLYVGYLGQISTTTIFDASAFHKDAKTGVIPPLTFTLGAQGLIPGFQIGINGMKVGGERLIAIPPSLGYGTQDVKDSSGKVIIPANSTLIFDVQLVKVVAGTSTPATAPAKTQ